VGKKVAADMPDEDPRRLVFYKEDVKVITKTLVTFLKDARARCVLLVDKDGHLITNEGDSSTHDMDTIVALVAGSFAATQQMARLLGEKESSIMFHRGEKDNIQLSLVGERTLLAVMFDDKTTLGMVRLYASQVTAKLTELFRTMVNRRGKGSDPFDGAGPTPFPA
jgi:predicted regulator of Ras-like GTPase activity (Roadblock/LC7/MglB family)